MERLKTTITALALSIALLLSNTAPVAASIASATYYHPKLSGQRMTNGKRYNPNTMTAAHRSLRIGKRVRVTNIKTKRSIYVTITDRCNCSLDLSMAAFKAVGGSTHRGRVKVRIQ